jgi:hypothetical protein
VYGPYLTPSNCHLFPDLKDHLGSHRFPNYIDKKMGLIQFLHLQDADSDQEIEELVQ